MRSPGSDYYVPGNTLSPIFPQLAYAPLAQQCPISGGANMTTLGRRATSNRACGELHNQASTNCTTPTAAVLNTMDLDVAPLACCSSSWNGASDLHAPETVLIISLCAVFLCLQ